MIVVHDVRRLAEVFRSLVKKVPRSAGGEEHVDTFTPIVHLYRIAIHGKGEPTGKPHPLNRYSGFVVNYGGARGDQEDAETEGVRVLVYSHPQPYDVVRRGRVDTVPLDPRLVLHGLVSVSSSAMDQLRSLWRREEESQEERSADRGTFRSTWEPMKFLPDYDVDERAKREIDRALSSGDVGGEALLGELGEDEKTLVERVYDVFRGHMRGAHNEESTAFTTAGVVEELREKYGVEALLQGNIQSVLTAMVRTGILEKVDRQYYSIGIQTRRFTWRDLTLLNKYFPKQFKPLLKGQNKHGGGDQLAAHVERARQQDARESGLGASPGSRPRRGTA